MIPIEPRSEVPHDLDPEVALRESEASLLAIVEAAIDGIITIDAHGLIESMNSAALKIFGYSAKELRGRNVKMLMPSPDREQHDFYLANYLRTKIRKIIGIGREVRGMRKDGTVFPMDLAVAEFAIDGQRKFAGFVRDISERKDLESKLLRSQRLESIGTLAGGIAHDLNNVLTPILMTVRMLRKDRPQEEKNDLLIAAETSVLRGVEIVRQLLSFAGGNPGARATVLLKDVFQELTVIIEHTFPKSINVRWDVADDLSSIVGDMTQLTQVLLNMCVNSRDAMQNGGTLSISARNLNVNGNRAILKNPDARETAYVVIRIEDNGYGISADAINKVFDPFFTTKEVGKGTGLGLATAQGIVKSHRGFINLYSEEGRGTVFTVYLPADPGAAPGHTMPSAAAPKKGNQELILVVDDESLIRMTAQIALESAGYQVILAGDGEQALALFESHRQSLKAIVLDMMMPQMDGRSTIRALRQRGATLPVIVVSGLRPPDADEILAPPVRVFLPKPYTDDELMSAIEGVLSRM